MTFKEIRQYSYIQAARFAKADEARRREIEAEITARSPLAGGAFSDRKPKYLVKTFVAWCEKLGAKTTLAPAPKATCPAPLAYRSMADIGPAAICGATATTPRGFCRQHDPETKPRRDARGRIVKRDVNAGVMDDRYLKGEF